MRNVYTKYGSPIPKTGKFKDELKKEIEKW